MPKQLLNPSPSSPPQTILHPSQSGAGQRLKAFLIQNLPRLLSEMTAGKSLPIQAKGALAFLPQVLQGADFDDQTAVQILETLDDLNADAWTFVLPEPVKGGDTSDD